MENKTYKSNYLITLLCIALIIPFLSIAGIKDEIPEEAYQRWQTSALVVFAILLITKSESIRINWSVRLFGFYQAVILASSLLNNGFSPGIAVTVITAFILFALLQTDCYYEMLSGISVVVVGSVLVSFPMVLMRSNEVNPTFFIGGKNYLGIFLIPGVFLITLNCLEHHKKLTKPVVAAVALALVTILLGTSGTGFVVAICAGFFWYRAQKKKPRKKVYLGALLVAYILFLVFAEVFFNTELWASFTEFLGKESDLTSRTKIWRSAMEQIAQKPLFGAGRGAIIEYINSMNYLQETHEAHNYILEILFEGGIVALILFARLFFRMNRFLNMDILKHRMLFIALFIILINGLTESINNNYLVVTILGVACRYATEEENRHHQDLLERQKERMQEQQSNEIQRIRRWRNGR